MRKLFILSVYILFSTRVFSNTDYKLLALEKISPQYAKMIAGWSRKSIEQKIALIENDQNGNYYGYFFRQLGFMYYLSENPQAKKVMLDALSILQANFNSAGIVQTRKIQQTGFWYRENFGRNGRLIYQAWNYTKEKAMLRFLETQVDLWLKLVPRKVHKGFNVYPYDYKSKNYEINPNQNIQLAVLFSYLYFDKESKYYQSSQLKDIAFNEVNAALSLVSESGALSLNERAIKVFDSNYGGYASSLLYELVQMWSVESWTSKLQGIGKWLFSAFPMSQPMNIKGHKQGFWIKRDDAFNLYGRIPAFYAAGITTAYSRKWMSFVKTKFPSFSILGGTVPRWYDLQTLPAGYFTSKSVLQDIKPLPPQIRSYERGQILVISVTSSNITTINIQADNGPGSVPIKDQKIMLKNPAHKITITVQDKSGINTKLDFDSQSRFKDILVYCYDYNHPISNK